MIPDFPFFRPDGLGLSVLITSPGLLFALAGRLATTARVVAGSAPRSLVLIPTLLYYGGGWLQYGYRYFLDSVPFVIALCGLAAVRPRADRVGLAGADRVRDASSWRSASTGRTTCDTASDERRNWDLRPIWDLVARRMIVAGAAARDASLLYAIIEARPPIGDRPRATAVASPSAGSTPACTTPSASSAGRT